MKKIVQIILLICCSICTVARAQANDGNWDKANAAYQQKQYDSAIFYYSAVLKKQPENGIVFYNLGNAYYRNNQVAEAVLNYEKALFYNADLKEAKDNLLLAKSRIPNAIKPAEDIFFLQWWKNGTAGNRATQWAVASVFIFLLILVLFFLNATNKKGKRIPFQAFLLLPLLNILFLLLAFTAAQNAVSSNKAVIMGNSAAMTTAPNIYKGQIILPQATTVEMNEQQGNWVAVTLPDNRTGWMQKSELTFVQSSPKK